MKLIIFSAKSRYTIICFINSRRKQTVDTRTVQRIDTTKLDGNAWAKLFDFTGKTAVITGGTGVLGGEIACGLAALGANVAILGRNLEAGRNVLARMGSRAEHSSIFACDVTNLDSLLGAAESIHKQFGSVDFLINAAGGNNSRATTTAQQKLFDLPPDALRSVFDLNLLGTVLPCQVFGREMADRGHGSIVNITSMAAVRPLTRVGAYAAAKAGISNFTQWLAVHLAQEYSTNIRVNAIAPGFFMGVQNRSLLIDDSGTLTARGQTIIAHTPMRRFGDPDELLGAVFWLLSPAASFVTGAVIPIDGGFGAYSGV